MKTKRMYHTSIVLACVLSGSMQAAEIKDVAITTESASSDNIHSLLKLNSDSEMRIKTTASLENGSSKVRFGQYYQGIPVFGYSVAATQSAMGQLSHVQGQFVDFADTKLKAKPKILAQQAMQQMLDNDQLLKMNPKLITQVYNLQNQLYVYLHQDEAKLVHRISYVVPSPEGKTPARPVYFVDAHSGEVLERYDNLQLVKAAKGPGGNAKIGCYEYGENFDLLDVRVDGANYVMDSVNVKTVNLDHNTTGDQAYSFLAPRNEQKAINGACSPINDAHYFGHAVFDMYNAYVNQPPVDFQVAMKVHYGNNYENAFWDGTSMYFGDGGDHYYPLVALDVIGHELSHGYTEQNANFVYYGMAGAINESFSDMAGEAAEYFVRGRNDFLVAADVYKGNGALRYFAHPPQDGRSIDHANDFSSGLDVHYGAGVYNKAFYLLATTPGWNTGKAFEVMALANKIYWNAQSSFNDAACGVENAADDMGYKRSDVMDALMAVGVECGICIDCSLNQLYKSQPVIIDDVAHSSRRFEFDVPREAKIVTFDIYDGSGDADLYVKFGDEPTKANYDCRPYMAGNSEHCRFDNAKSGIYHVMVYGYEAYNRLTLVADYFTDSTMSDTITDISLAENEMKTWVVEIPTYTRLFEISISGGNGDADLYVKAGSEPTDADYDCRPYKTGNEESCVLNNPISNNYYIGVKGYKASQGVTMQWQYTTGGAY